jgi:hypothetical protein
MRKAANGKPAMRAEYDFSKGVRGKYAVRYASGTNIVPIDPDVRDIFPDARSVNRVLRAIAQAVRSQRKAKSGARNRGFER